MPIMGMEDECVPKVGPFQYCLHPGPSFFFPQGAGLRTVLGLAASWPRPTTRQWDSYESKPSPDTDKYILEANILDRDSSLKNIVHTS